MCCTRRTFGLFIGGLTIGAYIVIAIVLGVSLNDDKVQENDQAKAIIVTIIVFVIALISVPVLLILGILQNRHKYMLPYLFLGVFGFVINCIRAFIAIIYGMAAGVGFGVILVALLIYGLTLALSYYILKILYELYKEIRDGNEGNGATGGIVYSAPGKPFETAAQPNYYV